MKITYLEVTNFKSYYGTQVLGPFSDHFTCIIGPNGNGKSNILDAMLFVFGFKSSKLRQDCLASLIHCSAYGQPQQAKVTVKFTSPTNPFTVSRTIRKNGYSFYQLNDKKIQWQELRQLLMSHAIDLEKNLFIILQGEVQRLCELGPEKLGEYLEYVSGSDQYVAKIAQLQGIYVEKSLQGDKVKQRLGISKRIFAQQQKQTFQILQHIVHKLTITELSFLLVKTSYSTIQFQHNSLTKQLNAHQSELNTLNIQLTQLQTQHKKTTSHLNINNQSLTDLSYAIVKEQQNIQRLEKTETKKLQDEVGFCLRDIRQKEREVEMVVREREQLVKIKAQSNLLSEKITEMEQLIGKVFTVEGNLQGKLLQGKYAESNNIIESPKMEKIQRSNKNKPKNSSNKQQDYQDNQTPQKLNKKSSNPQQIQSSAKKPLICQSPCYLHAKNIIKLRTQITKLQQYIASTVNKILVQNEVKHQSMVSQHEKLVKRYGAKGERFSQSSQLMVRLKVQIRQMTQIQSETQRKLTSVQQKLDELNRRAKQHETTQLLQTSQQKLISELKTANKLGVILRGSVLSTLRQHIVLPSEESTLVSAITPQLDFLIVQNHEEAREVIKFLVARKLGRMSFILKDEITKTMEKVDTKVKGPLPKGCKRIFDMAQVLSKDCEGIWFWAIGNTLLADTMDDAMKAAYSTTPHYRVITYKGEFIDSSGTMTKVPLHSKAARHQDKSIVETRIRIFTSQHQKQYSKLTQTRTQKQSLIEKLDNILKQQKQQTNFASQQQLQQHLKCLQQQIKQSQQSLVKIRSDKANNELSVKMKERECNQLREKIRNEVIIGNRINLSVEQVIELVDRYEQLLAKVKKIAISEQLLEVNEAKLKSTRQQLQELNKALTAKRQSILSLSTEIDKLKEHLRTIITQKRELQSQNSKLQQLLFVKELEIKRITGDAGVKNQGNMFFRNEGKERTTKEQNDNRRQKQAKIPNINKANNKNKLKGNIQKPHINNHNSTPPSINTLKQNIYQLSTLIAKTQIVLQKLSNHHSILIQRLSKLFNYLWVLSQDQKAFGKNFNSVQEVSVNINEIEENYDSMKQKQKKCVPFRQVLIDFVQANGLVDIGEYNFGKQQTKHTEIKKQDNMSNQPRKQSHDLIPQIQGKSKHSKNSQNPNNPFNRSQLRSIIQKGFFDSKTLVTLSQSDSYTFTKLISRDEYQYIFQTKELDQKNTIPSICSKQENLLLSSIDRQHFQRMLNAEKQKIAKLQAGSSSLVLKSSKKKIPRKITEAQQMQVSMLQDDNQQNPLPSYFSDLSFPLDPYQLSSISQYMRIKSTLQAEQSTLTSLQQNLSQLSLQLLKIRQLRTTLYLTTFNLINLHLNKIYNTLTQGNAQLNLVNSINPFEGIEFSVRPFKKSWKSVNLLSGGQKTLTSLALIFACEQVRKFPFYFMDEIDAALDHKNVSRLAKYIKEKEHVQHIVISLRKNMYQECDTLVCIYKLADITRTLRLDMTDLYSRPNLKQPTNKQQKYPSPNSTQTIHHLQNKQNQL